MPAYSFACTGVFTNKTPTDAYRGAGRPEATYAIERAIDALAAQMDLDPAEIRRRNFIPSDKFPYTIEPGCSTTAGTTNLRSPGARDGRVRRAARRAGRTPRAR